MAKTGSEIVDDDVRSIAFAVASGKFPTVEDLKKLGHWISRTSSATPYIVHTCILPFCHVCRVLIVQRLEYIWTGLFCEGYVPCTSELTTDRCGVTLNLEAVSRNFGSSNKAIRKVLTTLVAVIRQ